MEVKYDGEQLRAYAFHYREGAFSKTLLDSIVQKDSRDRRVAVQGFSYYNDIAQGIFSDTPEVYTAEKDDCGRLVSSHIGNLDESMSLLGGGSARGNTVGGGVMVGAGWGPASVNAGGSYSYSKSDNEGRIALVDINGDGMPDKVWKGADGKLYYRLNQNRDLSHPSFGEEMVIRGISSFTGGTTTSNTRNANVAAGFGPASAGYAVSKTTDQSKNKTYFQDFNADGLIDIACNGTVRRLASESRPLRVEPPAFLCAI